MRYNALLRFFHGGLCGMCGGDGGGGGGGNNPVKVIAKAASSG
jgi:hypothetical protein